MGDPDAILARIEELMGRVKDTDDEPESGRKVPYERFAAVNSRLKAAEEGLALLRTEHEAVITAHQEALAGLETRLTTEHQEAIAGLETRYAEEARLTEHGLDGPGRDALRLHWDRLPEGDRGESPSSWWAAQVEAEPDKRALPRTLTPYLPAPAVVEEPAQRRGGVILGAVDRGVVTQKASLSDRIEAARSSADPWAALQQVLAEADAKR